MEDDLAGGAENVLIRAGDCMVTLLPELGGKISSIRIGEEELLQAPLKALDVRSRSMLFEESDASGWDECLPSVAQCSVETDAGTAAVPDHGDLWRVPWRVLEATEDSATMRAQCFSLPLELTRSLIVSETAVGWELQLLYSLTNLGAYQVPWSWSAHPLFAVEAGDRIVLPEAIRELRVEGSGGGRIGGNTVGWPVARVFDLLPGDPSTRNRSVKDPTTEDLSIEDLSIEDLSIEDLSIEDLSIAKAADRAIGDKLFAGPFASGSESWGTLERARIGLRLTMEFDPALTPYLGLWICYGGWPETPGPKQVCVAIEPCTAPVDSLAIQGGWSRSLEVGETFSWPITLRIEKMTRWLA